MYKYILFTGVLLRKFFIMKFVILADEEKYKSLCVSSPNITWIRAQDEESFLNEPGADAYFNTNKNSSTLNYSNLTVPVFINSVNITLKEINAPANVIRINGWPGFTEKETWEIAGNVSPAAKSVLQDINKKFIPVNDEPGFVTARIIAMIINEAYFASGENISSEQDIDIAMKLGTNYPYGPFEWSKIIGLDNIYSLLKKLSLAEVKYTAAPALENACKTNL